MSSPALKCIFAALCLASTASALLASEPTPPRQSISIPITFERNEGQAPRPYQFVSRHGGVQALFSPHHADLLVPTAHHQLRRVRMDFLNPAAAPQLQPGQTLPGHANYLHGRQSSAWITNLPTFADLRYAALYPGVDLLFHADPSGHQLEHDFLLAPHADPRLIRFALRGADTLRILPNGDLAIQIASQTLLFHQPIAYQQTANSARTPVRAAFQLSAANTVTFRVGPYDHARPLTIDPVLSFSTYLDGTGQDLLSALTTDSAGNIYAVGATYSINFPVAGALQSTNGDGQDAFIAKLDPTGHTLLYSTYLGGSDPDEAGSNQAESVAVDANQNVIVSGISSSPTFPQAGNLSSQDPNYTTTYNFLASLNATGSALRYSGFLGATLYGFDDGNVRINAVTADAQGNAYFAGVTDDASFTLTAGAYGASVAPYPANLTLIAAKVQSNGSFAYAADFPTSISSSSSPVSPGQIAVGGIAVDSTGDLLIAGTAGNNLLTTSGALTPSFPNTPGVNDVGYAGFALKLNPAGSTLDFSTYLPGTDGITSLALDATGNLYLAGDTYETNLPTASTAFQPTLIPRAGNPAGNGFVFKLSSDGTTAMGATYFGGTVPQGLGPTIIDALQLDPSGNIAVGGGTGAFDLPLKNPITSILNEDGIDFDYQNTFVAEFSPDLSTLLFSTYLSAPDYGTSFDALAVAPSGQLIVGAGTISNQFPTTSGSYQSTPPAESNPYSDQNRITITSINLAVAAPSICLASTSVTLPATRVNTSSSTPVTVTNCGNADLTLTSAVSSSVLVAIAQNCTAVAPGATCQLTLTFTPTVLGTDSGTITLTGNTSFPTSQLAFTGVGGEPNVSLPASLTFSDLLVGQQSNGGSFLSLTNYGTIPFTLTSATVTGDFVLIQNTCTAALPPEGSCELILAFSPTAAGLRTGTLTLVDNLSPATQTIALSGNGLTTAPVPTIAGIPAIPAVLPQDSPGGVVLTVYGTGFLPSSTLSWNGSPRTTEYVNETLIEAILTPTDIQSPTEGIVTITNPAPGGGTSNAFPADLYGILANIQVTNEVVDPTGQFIYATVATTSPTYPNSVIVLNPTTMQVVNTLLIGNTPDAIAISTDGTLLYVGLDQTSSVTQIALPSGTQNFTVALPVNPTTDPQSYPILAAGLKVVPGSPHTWVAGLCAQPSVCAGTGVAVFDDAVVRPTQVVSTTVFNGSFAFTSNPAFVYSPGITAFQITSTGIANITPSTSSLGAIGPVASDGTLIYASNGEVIDPSTFTLKLTYPQAYTISQQDYPVAFNLGAPNDRVYFTGFGLMPYTSGLPGLGISAVGKTSESTISQVFLPIDYDNVAAIERFGTNGLFLREPSQLLFFQTSLVTTAPPAPILTATVSPTTLTFPSQLLNTPSILATVTLTNTGNTALTISGIATTGDYSQTNTCGSNLPAGVSCTVSITFTPTAAGDQPGTLTITDNATAGPQTVTLDGTGNSAAPVLSATVSPTSLTFPAQLIDTFSTAKTVTLTNTGNADLTFSGLFALTGDYEQTNTCSSTLAPGAFCTISVVFSPTSAGDRTGILTVNDNATAGPQTVTLDGTGTAPSPITVAPQTSGSTTATVASGTTASYNLQLTTTTYTGAVTLACTGAPTYANCTVNPASPSVTAGQPTNFTVTVTTSTTVTSQSSGQPVARNTLPSNRPQIEIRGSGEAFRSGHVLLSGLGLLALLGIPLLLPLRRNPLAARLNRTLPGALFLLVAAFLALSGSGCAGAGSGSGGTAPPTTITNNTPAGTYTLTLTAQAGTQSTTQTLTLVVQ